MPDGKFRVLNSCSLDGVQKGAGLPRVVPSTLPLSTSVLLSCEHLQVGLLTICSSRSRVEMRPLGDKEARLLGEVHATLGPGDVFGEDALFGGLGNRFESATVGGSVFVIASLVEDDLLASLKAYIEGEADSPAYLLRQAWCRAALEIEPDERGDAEMARVAHVLDR